MLAFVKAGYVAFGTDILTGVDFLTYDPTWRYDCIVTNPPYSLKQEFLERCYELNKPFALLLPLTALETERRQRLFRKYGVEIILMPYRVKFDRPVWTEEQRRKSSSWFATAWFTHGLDLGRQLIFWNDNVIE